ncbi:TPA: hypothetical protein ACH3X3_006557 [Trebouxia sp. C0006]
MSQSASMQTETGATAVNVEAAPAADNPDQSIQRFQWTPRKFCQSISLFILSAASEVGGGWLVWQSIRSGKPWWWGLLGSVTLVVYGFIPTLQPVDQFGRTFAAYGGFFIVYSYGWGWLLDHERPDTGDFAGAGIALAGVCICWFWPRKVRTD